jgi:subtilisin family serine protease/PKD repeat protein
MTRRTFFAVTIAIFCTVLILSILNSTSLVQAKTTTEKAKFRGHHIVEEEVIIKFKEGQEATANFLNNYNLKSANKLLKRHKFKGKALEKANARGLHRLYVAYLKAGVDIANVIRVLNLDPRVEYAEPNYVVKTNIIPNDPDFNQLWGLHNTGQSGGTPDADIDASEAWDVTHDSTVIVGVIDTGVDYTHEDLATNMWSNPNETLNGFDDDLNGFIDDIYGWNFVNDTNDPFDDHYHGTHVSGTIGGIGNNGVGVVGVNWNVKIAALKFLNSSGSGSTAGAVGAVSYANMMGFPITSNSWGGGGFSQALFDAISAANDAGYLFIAAAGNSSVDTDFSPHYPSSYNLPNLISVAATDRNDNLSSFSNYGLNSVDLGAPGSSIYSSVPTGYTYLSGTSMATPHVSGAAALLWEFDPSLTHLEVKDKIMNLAEPIDSLQGKTVTGSRLNIYNFFDNDTVPPAVIDNLEAVDKTHSSVTLQWTSVGDDFYAGTASRYDLRYSENPIINTTDFDSASELICEPMPSLSGTIETFKVTGLQQNTTYYFALMVFDNVGNGTLNSNLPVSETTLTATVVFSDDMENSQNGWTVDGTGGIPNPSLWHQSQRRAASPTNSWYYGQESTGNYNTGMANQGSITSPDIDLSSLVGSELTFRHFLSTENLSPYDTGSVQISNDGGFNWATVSARISTADNWINESVDISAFDGSSIKVRFHFATLDSILNNFEGWYVDDVVVQGTYIGANTKPVANAGGAYAGNEDSPITFNGAGSSDNDGDPLTYQWDFGDGATGGGVSPSHTYTQGGNYTVTLIVNDGIEDSVPDTAGVNVTEINDPPVADAGNDQSGLVGGTLFFDGSGSDDEEGPISSYDWDFGDGTSANGQIVTHSYTTGNDFVVTLTVTDVGELTDSDTANVDIDPVSITDTVSITKAEYRKTKSILMVEATSSEGGTAVLTLEGGYGFMDYNSRKDKYKLTVVTPMPDSVTVTVTSSEGGFDTATVTERAGKSKKK